MKQTTSQPSFADLEIRISPRDDHGYPVEITLNGEQQLARGYLPADIASLDTGGDPVAVGQRLFNILFADNNHRAAWARAQGQAPRRRVRLWLDARAPELHALPWELLADDSRTSSAPLSANADTPFSRYLATPEPWGGEVKEYPIRVLAVLSNPEDLEDDPYNLAPLDLAVEQDSLREAISTDQIKLDFLPLPATLMQIEQALQHAPGYHILHYVGHGAFNRRRGQAMLYLQDEEAYTAVVPDEDFTAMLQRLSQPPRLVFLTACQSAKPSTTRSYLGLGPKLVEAGVPAVVAMQGTIGIATARKLAQAFYGRLAEHGLVDCAMNEARSQLLTAKRPDAAVPVLFMRLKSGQLWSDETTAEATRTAQTIYQATVTGSGSIAQGPGATSAGEGGTAISGDVHGDIIIGGR
ncbi:MAG: CHAT domain-containing protein [Chloroflexi bacterium]|nr:CHAT domain-containing protein [Chloroflexota bacterium]